MSKVNFKRNNQNFDEVKDFFIDNAKDIDDLCDKLKKDGIPECAKVYCELLNGIWDEDNLGEFKGELFANVFEKYLLLNSNPYRLQKYCACHNPYSKHNLTEEEFDNVNLIMSYNNGVMSDHAQYANLFYCYAIAYRKLTAKQ